MSESKFYWDGDTIDYYVKESRKFGNFHTAFEIYKYVADECDWEDEADMRAVYLDLLLQVENKINVEL
jgi:hypothetical protein